MNRGEHLLTILIEECAEVAQAATKAMRFGMHEQRDLPTSNYDRLKAELDDIYALIEMIQCEFNIDLEPDHLAIRNKQDKVEKYLLYSKECGTLSDPLTIPPYTGR